MKKINFQKYEAVGNDFIIIDQTHRAKNEGGFQSSSFLTPELSRRLCDRNKGIGADGIIVLLSSDCADIRIQVYNADGSRANNCGNGLRCVGRWLVSAGRVQNFGTIVFEELEYPFEITNGHVRVEMGKAAAKPVRVFLPGETSALQKTAHFVTLGNDHLVICEQTSDEDALIMAELIWAQGEFGKPNIGFVSSVCANQIKLKVIERGAGLTKSCGSGACAAVVALVEKGHDLLDTDVNVHFPGGEIFVRAQNASDEPLQGTNPLKLNMTGPANLVFSGCVEL